MVVLIKQGTSSEVPQLLKLIQALAEYEKATPDALSIDIPTLKRDFELQRFRYFLATDDDEPIGFLMFHSAYSSWRGHCLYMEDFFVRKEHRRAGVGGQLLDSLVAIAKEEKAERIVWVCLDWNQIGISYYNKIKAKWMKDWRIYRLERDQIENWKQ